MNRGDYCLKIVVDKAIKKSYPRLPVVTVGKNGILMVKNIFNA